MLISLLWQEPQIFLLVLLSIILAITVHEFGHAFLAYVQGDRTALYEGRLTFNPLRHIDPIGFVLLLVAGFGWGKPVPFNPYNLRSQKFGPFLVGLAGPFFNILSVLVYGIILHFAKLSTDNLLAIFLQFLITINLNLAIFNLIPLPPLDGSKILYTFLVGRYDNVILFLERNSLWILLGLLFLGFPGLSFVLNAAQSFVFSLIF